MKKFFLIFLTIVQLNLHAQTLRPVQYASSVIDFSSQYGTTDYSAGRALGAPDVYPNCGSNVNAWTSATASSQREWLILGFSNPQPVNTIRIYQAIAPGAVDTIYLRDAATGLWQKVYSASAVAPGDGSSCPGVAHLLLEVTIPTTTYNADAIRIAINSPAVTTYYNEIDAVGVANFDNMPAQTNQYAGSVLGFSSEYLPSPGDFSAAQLIGAPDAPFNANGCATEPKAWASLSQNGQREWLVLGYSQPGSVNRVTIYQVTAPGAVDTVYLREANTNTWHTVYTASATATPCNQNKALEINFTATTYPVDAVRIALNSPAVTSYWNEIDAVSIRSDATPLPVVFGPIQAVINHNRLHVSWTAEAETNNSHYRVEASADGLHFKPISEKIISKAPDGNSAMPLSYSFSANTTAYAAMGLALFFVLGFAAFKSKKWKIALACMAILACVAGYSCTKSNSDAVNSEQGKLFIRIAQVDKDGTIKYSKIVQVVTNQ